MSNKDNAMAQLLALLECRYAMRVLWALRDGHAQTFRLLQDSVGGITPNTLHPPQRNARSWIYRALNRRLCDHTCWG